MHPSLLALLFLFLVALGMTTGYAATNSYEKDIVAFEASDRTNPPPANAILFVGDSQFTRWHSLHEDLPGYRVINRGFGGSTMPDLLQYLGRIVLPYRARMIVVNEGGNDIHAGRTPEQLLADITTFVTRVRTTQPDVPIILTGLAPSPARWNERDIRLRFNRMLLAYASAEKNIIYLDIFNGFLGADGKPNEALFVEDKLHHSAAGYAVRVRIMRPFLGPPDFPERSPKRH